VYDCDAKKTLAGHLSVHKREVASLTKMMTFWVSQQVFQKYFPEETQLKINVPSYCTKVPGTSAFLKRNDELTLD